MFYVCVWCVCVWCVCVLHTHAHLKSSTPHVHVDGMLLLQICARIWISHLHLTFTSHINISHLHYEDNMQCIYYTNDRCIYMIQYTSMTCFCCTLVHVYTRVHSPFAEYRLFYRSVLHKRPIILRSLLIIATLWILNLPYEHNICCMKS